MRVIVGLQGTDKQAASTNTMSLFEIEVLGGAPDSWNGIPVDTATVTPVEYLGPRWWQGISPATVPLSLLLSP